MTNKKQKLRDGFLNNLTSKYRHLGVRCGRAKTWICDFLSGRNLKKLLHPQLENYCSYSNLQLKSHSLTGILAKSWMTKSILLMSIC